MKSPFHHIKHAHKVFDHFHKNLHHAFVLVVGAIIGMLRGASNIFISTHATRQWGGFITNDFRNQNPTTGNIMYTLYGDGNPGNTAYTRLRDSSCAPTNIVYLPSNFSGGVGNSNTIYILNSGNYTLTSPISFTSKSCSAIIGTGDVYIKESGNNILNITNSNNIIIDNIKLWGSNGTGALLQNISNISFHNIDVFNHTTGLLIDNSFLYADSLRIYNNIYGVLGSGSNHGINLNNSLIYNNIHGATIGMLITNNSQVFNNTYGLEEFLGIHNNTIFYNNTQYGIIGAMPILNNTLFYNNGTGIVLQLGYNIYYFGNIKMFGNTHDTSTGAIFTGGLPSFTPPSSRISPGTIDTGSTTIGYDVFTNPQNGSGKWLLSGSNRNILRGIQSFDHTKKPTRYIFGLNIPQQNIPIQVSLTGGSFIYEYGNDIQDYTTQNYIAEPESILPQNQQDIVNQYFGSGSTFTQNRQTNGCSLSAFQIIYLTPGIFSTTYNFQDHTIYILTGGEYRSANPSFASVGFAFTGNCIALVGNDNTIFTKSTAMGLSSLLYAYNKYNIIIDNIKIDGLYYNNGNDQTVAAANNAIKFDGTINATTNNTTINDVQAYNTAQYGIYLGLGSHHNTIINTQLFNNMIAGMHLYYSSNYNVINNTQMYNNGSYGIWFANGSSRNTMNNFQSYNNGSHGVFGDLTTQENTINRAAIYNNGGAGIYFEGSSGNILNDIRLYNNQYGIQTLYSSLGNKYYGELKMFNNSISNLDGSNGNDGYLSAGSAGLFSYGGTMNTGTTAMSCFYATNPTLSGNGATLLSSTCTNTGYITSFVSPYTLSVNYAFGLGMYKQKVPVRYEIGGTLIQIPSQYDANKYIAEVFAIRDDDPEGVFFEGSGSTQLNTRYTTNIYTAGILNIAVPITLTLNPTNASGYILLSGTNIGLSGTVNNGDTIQIKVLTATGYNQIITGTVNIGSVTTGFIVKTRDYNQLPTTGSFAFMNFTSIPVDTFTGSIVTVSGIETGVYASLTFDPITTSGWLEIYSGSTMVSSGTTGLLLYNGYKVKAIGQSSSGLSQTVTGYVTIGLGTGSFTITTKGSDSIAPTTPTLTYPLSGEELFFITWEWMAATDTGSGIEGYVYEIAEDPGFIDIVYTGFIAGTGTTGSPNTDFDETSDTFYRRLQARDNDGNLSSWSNTGTFEAIDADERNFDEEDNVSLRTYYDSNEITLNGIKAGVSIWASVDDNGVLYKDGDDKGTGSFVQNDDTIYLTVRSSNRYDKTISATLTIANRTLSFDVTTKAEDENGCTLSDEDQTAIQEIFDSLIENYSGSDDRYDEFLYTMQSMLADEIDFTNDCNLQYLEDLIAEELGGNTGGETSTGTHIAPNCKEYSINYNTTLQAYYSPLFKVTTYFANRDALTRYIDSKNPGDCHINSYGVSSWVFTNTDSNKHIAANGKIYIITNDGQGYTSPGFSVAKHFASINALRGYIDTNNPPPQVWNHEVDISFNPQTYTAPNTKEYTLYKTNKGYMSYKLLRVQYFSTLAELQNYINRNNSR